MVKDARPDKWGVGGGLLYQGRNGVYSLKTQEKTAAKSFEARPSLYHIKNRLCDVGSDTAVLLKSYLRDKGFSEDGLPHFSVDKLRTTLGVQYGRIMRPVGGIGSFFAIRADEAESATLLDLYAQLDAFMYRFAEIARVVQPSENNMNSFGYEIRSSLILACTEVELLFKRLCAEDIPKRSLNITDYFACEALAKLSSYSVRFNLYQGIGVVKPFTEWSGAQTYVALSWYRAYNESKHNRLDAIEQANLRCLVRSLAACAVLLKAQTYSGVSLPQASASLERFKTQFTITSPQWNTFDNYWVVPGFPLRRIPVSQVT